MKLLSKGGGRFLGKIYQMINLTNFEIRKMKLEGTWCTEDIDNEHLQLRVFSTAEKNSFFKFSNERYVVFLERAKEIFKERIRVNFQRTILFE